MVFKTVLMTSAALLCAVSVETAERDTRVEAQYFLGSDKTHNRFSRRIAAVLRVPSGAIVQVDTKEATDGQLNLHSQVSDVTPGNSLAFHAPGGAGAFGNQPHLQQHGLVGVVMGYSLQREGARYFQADLFPELPAQGVFHCLPGLQFAAGELPQVALVAVGMAQRDQHLAAGVEEDTDGYLYRFAAGLMRQW